MLFPLNAAQQVDIDAIGELPATPLHPSAANTVYDLSGRRLGSATPPTSGIYIVNGRKVVVR